MCLFIQEGLEGHSEVGRQQGHFGAILGMDLIRVASMPSDLRDKRALYGSPFPPWANAGSMISISCLRLASSPPACPADSQNNPLM